MSGLNAGEKMRVIRPSAPGAGGFSLTASHRIRRQSLSLTQSSAVSRAAVETRARREAEMLDYAEETIAVWREAGLAPWQVLAALGCFGGRYSVWQDVRNIVVGHARRLGWGAKEGV